MNNGPGFIAKLPDGRTVIVYDKQPLLKAKGKVVLHVVDEKFEHVMGDNGPKTILKDVHVYNEEMVAAKHLGFVD